MISTYGTGRPEHIIDHCLLEKGCMQPYVPRLAAGGDATAAEPPSESESDGASAGVAGALRLRFFKATGFDPLARASCCGFFTFFAAGSATK